MGRKTELPWTIDERFKVDKTILVIFSAFAAVSLSIPPAALLLVDDLSLLDAVSRLLGGLTTSFLLAGIHATRYYGKRGSVPMRRIMRYAVMAASAMMLTLIAGIAVTDGFQSVFLEMPTLTTAQQVFAGTVLAVVLLIVFFFVLMVGVVTAFGVVGVMCALERRLTAWTLERLVRSEGRERRLVIDRVLTWFFDIPEVLDTRTLTISPSEPKKSVGWSDIKAPVAWQLFFGAVLAIYISFNPFLSDRSPAALVGIFSILSSAAILIPFVILPWFIFRKLGARIKGQVKEFSLFNGIRARVLQSYLAIGTIVVLVRMSISRISMETYLAAFASFALFLLIVSVLTTFVYLGYFENDLSDDIATDFNRRVRPEQLPTPAPSSHLGGNNAI
mgnify:CR=1 FL=1